MPNPLVRTLSAPIRRVQALVGPGWSGDPTADPAMQLTAARDELTNLASSAARSWNRTEVGWSGAGADAAAEFAATTAAAIEDAAERAGRLGATAEQAADAVARAHRRLQAIVEDFEAKAGALEPRLDSPGVAKELLAEARRSLAEAISVVEELLAELDGHARALDATAREATGREPSVAADSPAATSPAGFNGASPGGMGSGLGGVAPLGGQSGWDSAGFGEPTGSTEDWSESADEASYGQGLAVRLPDGTVVMAPNATAASAVRHALTQLGVPYQWGGTSPGVGLDCSGLTQWAYDEAGLNIPRLAQEQDIGAAVAPGSLLPGDLAVWDGHVAMIVGDGTMIEAGDPVMLSPVRTGNAGQGFQGFWRPTA